MEKFTVFVASPGDVQQERDLLEKVIREINETHGSQLGYELELWRWESNAYPSASKPQDLINSIAKPYQIFVGIMWKRFGTPTIKSGSGTEEEYRIAYEAWMKKNVVEILFYFCKKPVYPNSLEENEQLGKVIKFKQELNGKQFIWNYNNPRDFEEKIRKHLCNMMNEVMKKKNETRQQPRTEPDEQTTRTFHEAWNHMTPELQNMLSIPYNENRMRGDGGIKTKDLFAAMLTQPNEQLQAVLKHIPPAALPEPLQGTLVEDHYIVNEQPWLSHCIVSSLKRLNKALPQGQQLTALDVFIDIARNGTGYSVAQLRKNNIGPEKIEKIIRQENLKVVGM